MKEIKLLTKTKSAFELHHVNVKTGFPVTWLNYDVCVHFLSVPSVCYDYIIAGIKTNHFDLGPQAAKMNI